MERENSESDFSTLAKIAIQLHPYYKSVVESRAKHERYSTTLTHFELRAAAGMLLKKRSWIKSRKQDQNMF